MPPRKPGKRPAESGARPKLGKACKKCAGTNGKHKLTCSTLAKPGKKCPECGGTNGRHSHKCSKNK